jgi:hypothetical protein
MKVRPGDKTGVQRAGAGSGMTDKIRLRTIAVPMLCSLLDRCDRDVVCGRARVPDRKRLHRFLVSMWLITLVFAGQPGPAAGRCAESPWGTYRSAHFGKAR